MWRNISTLGNMDAMTHSGRFLNVAGVTCVTRCHLWEQPRAPRSHSNLKCILIALGCMVSALAFIGIYHTYRQRQTILVYARAVSFGTWVTGRSFTWPGRMDLLGKHQEAGVFPLLTPSHSKLLSKGDLIMEDTITLPYEGWVPVISQHPRGTCH